MANGVANGHVTPVQESPFTGYIIAMHRKMVRTLRRCSVPPQKSRLGMTLNGWRVLKLAFLPLQRPCLSSQMRTELYFLSSQKNRPSLFGMPLIVPCTVHTTKKDLYDAVWIQVSRLASPLPPQEASNHAQDWYAHFHCASFGF